MHKRILTIALACAIALASAATLAGCGEKKEDDKKVKTTTVSATTKPSTAPGTTAAAVATDANGNTVSADNAAGTNPNNLTTLAPDSNAANADNSNGIVDSALAAGGYSKANGYWGSIYTSYTSNGVTYYAVNILDANNIVQNMIWVSPDGTTFDSQTFYDAYIAPDYNADPNRFVEESPTYYIGQDGQGYPTTPVYADENNYNNGEDNTVAAYQGE